MVYFIKNHKTSKVKKNLFLNKLIKKKVINEIFVIALLHKVVLIWTVFWFFQF